VQDSNEYVVVLPVGMRLSVIEGQCARATVPRVVNFPAAEEVHI
jgi:hypothetical protein